MENQFCCLLLELKYFKIDTNIQHIRYPKLIKLKQHVSSDTNSYWIKAHTLGFLVDFDLNKLFD